MPHVYLEAANDMVALEVKYKFGYIQEALRQASANVLGYKYEDMVVLLPPAMLAVSPNADLLVIKPFASDNEKIHGKEEDWLNSLAITWYNLMNSQPEVFQHLLNVCPIEKVSVWPQIAQGARWGNVQQIVDQLALTNL